MAGASVLPLVPRTKGLGRVFSPVATIFRELSGSGPLQRLGLVSRDPHPDVAFLRRRNRTQDLTSYGDVLPEVALKWNQGVNNFMVYGTGDIPVGDYDPNRLANLGIAHGAIDFGGGYTYFDPKSGNEFSWVTGLTYNFKNTSTQYQNGMDFHVDLGASHFFDNKLQIGVVGYYLQQVTDDFGTPPALDGFRSRIAGVGPQVGFLFPVGDMQGYVNVKAYKEFAAQNRPEGWNAWLTFALSPPSAPEPSSAKRTFHK
jgi:hypothetical protein